MGVSVNATPILVLGSPRSGTTWLGNILASHREIAGAHADVHWGSVECPLYQIQEWAGDLSDDRHYIHLLETFAASDYFRLVAGDKESFYKNRAKDFYEMFFDLMDRFAALESSDRWVVKLDPPYYYRAAARAELFNRMNQRYRRVEVVAIIRDFPSVLRSYLNMESQSSLYRFGPIKLRIAVCLEAARYVAHNTSIRRIAEERGGLILAYSELRHDTKATLGRLGDHLGVDFSASVSPYPSNSSLAPGKPQRSMAITAWIADRVLVPMFRATPSAAIALVKLRDRTRRKTLPFYWRLLRREHMPERLSDELWQSGQIALHRTLFEEDP